MAEKQDQDRSSEVLKSVDKRLEDIQTNTNMVSPLADELSRLSGRLNSVSETIPRLDEKSNSLSKQIDNLSKQMGKQIDNLSKQIDSVGADSKSHRKAVSGYILAAIGAFVAAGIYVHQDLRDDNGVVKAEISAVTEKLDEVVALAATPGQSEKLIEATIRKAIKKEIGQLIAVRGDTKSQNNIFIVGEKHERREPPVKSVRDETGQGLEPQRERWFSPIFNIFKGKERAEASPDANTSL
jgi:uncharacterized phage infection (PIP) family protein YhgE